MTAAQINLQKFYMGVGKVIWVKKIGSMGRKERDSNVDERRVRMRKEKMKENFMVAVSMFCMMYMLSGAMTVTSVSELLPVELSKKQIELVQIAS